MSWHAFQRQFNLRGHHAKIIDTVIKLFTGSFSKYDKDLALQV